MKLTQNNTALLVAPKQPPQVITIPHDDLERIIFRGERLIEQTQQQPFFKNKSRYQVINTLISQAKLERDFVRLSILYFARTAYVSEPKLQKWGIIKVAIGSDMWGYELLADWNKPNTKKGKFKTTQKTKQKSIKKADDTAPTPEQIRNFTAFVLYTDLHQTNPLFNATKINNYKGLADKNINEVLSYFDDYLEYENQTITNLDNKTDVYYQYCDFMQSKAPLNHRQKICRTGDTHFLYNKKTKATETHNDRNCDDLFCPYCNNPNGDFKEQLARQVQQTHIANGGECLQLTLAPPPHTLKTRLEPIKVKMQTAYELFTERTAQALNKLGYQGKLKRFDPVYSLAHGHHPHIHTAYAVAPVTDEQLGELSAFMRETWLDCMIETKLIKKKERQTIKNKGVVFDLRRNEQAFSYVARKHKSKFTLSDLPSLAIKAKTKCLTPYELGFLAMNGVIKDEFFGRIYQEILTAFYDTTQLKYSRGFLAKLGLKQYHHSKPSKGIKKVLATLAPPRTQTAQNPPKIEQQCDKKGQCLLDLAPPHNDNGQFLLIDRIEPPKRRKERADKGKSRPKAPPTMTATPKYTETGQGVLFTGDYGVSYPTMPTKPQGKHLVHLSTLTYEQMTALTQAKAIGLYSGMLKHAYEKGYFKNNVPFS